MGPDQEQWARDLEQLRPVLVLLARQNVNPRLWKDVDPSGVVQETLLEAARSQNQFEGRENSSPEGWIRRILLNNLYDALRKVHRDKRDVDREVSLAGAILESSGRLERQLFGGDPSPSERAMAKEETLALANALAELEPSQRDVVELYHLQGRSLSETSTLVGKSESAVAALLHRGLKRLRELLQQR